MLAMPMLTLTRGAVDNADDTNQLLNPP